MTKLDLARAIFADFVERGSVEALLANVAPDVVLKNAIPEDAPFGGEFHGRDGILDYFARVDTVLDLDAVHVTDYLENEDTVVVLGSETLRLKSTGEKQPSLWCTVLRFQGLQITRIVVIEDHSALSVALAKGR